MSDDDYFRLRFTPDPRRRILYQTLLDWRFQSEISSEGTVLDLGAGYGDFINCAKARRRIAVDRWPGMARFLEAGVEGIVTSADNLHVLGDQSIDYVFSSNCLEHLNEPTLLGCLCELKRTMKTGATLTILQPNYRLCSRRYFEDPTHVSIHTDQSLSSLLKDNGFSIKEVVPGLLPLTLRSRWPVHPTLIRLYLASPIRPLARQMLISAIR